MDSNLNYKVIDSMTTVIDNLVECLTVEICMEKSKNLLTSCIYRRIRRAICVCRHLAAPPLLR